jgi:hypothetical protein
MRKLWPPYYDDASLRLWATSVSVVINLIVVVLAFSGSVFSFTLGMPGWMVFMAFMVVKSRGIEEATVNLSAIIIGFLVNFGFYYFIARWVFSAFQPVQGWWPEKRS